MLTSPTIPFINESLTPDPEHSKININLGWDKLNHDYAKLDEHRRIMLPP